MKKAFTLIELLVVIAIIAILAAILFPVFAQAKVAAKKASDLSNLNQIGLSTIMYSNDFDDLYYPHRDNCKDGGGNWIICPQYLNADGTINAQFKNLGDTSGAQVGGSNSSLSRFFYVFMLQPYTKNQNIFINPGGDSKFDGNTGPVVQCGTYADGGNNGCIGADYGGQNSYGHNDPWLSPAAAFNGSTGGIPTISQSSVPRVASTILLTDATYYGVAPDVLNMSGYTQTNLLNGNEANYISHNGSAGFSFYLHYWGNIGSGKYSYSTGTQDWTNGASTQPNTVVEGQKLFGGSINCEFADGHTHAEQYKNVIGNICLWSTDADGAHPGCN